MSKLSNCSRAAKFQLLTSKDGTGMNLFSKDAQWPTFGTNPGIFLADRVPKIRYRLKERDWLDHTEKDGGQDGTVTRRQASIILICKQTSKAFIKSASM